MFRAPAKPFFYLALLATEAGQYLAILSLLAFAMSRRWLCLIAALLFISPTLRAQRMAPIDWKTLFVGTSLAHIQPQTVPYIERDGTPLQMDIFPHPLGARRPGILVIHGGSWSSGGRADFDSLTRHLWNEGYVIASLDYRLSPQSHFPAARDDIFAALGYLKSHAEAFGLDDTQIVLLGRSAGGQLALSAAYDPAGRSLRGVIAFYAPNDLKLAYTKPGNPLIINSQKVISEYLGGSLSQIPAQYEAASPLFHAGKESPATLLIHGSRDEFVWPLHSERLTERLTALGRPCEYLKLPWATHGADYFLNGPSGQIITQNIERFLANTTGGTRS